MTTGLTVMEVELPTGYVIMNDDMRLYVQSGEVPTLRRAFYYSKKVVFYLDYVCRNISYIYIYIRCIFGNSTSLKSHT